MPDRSTCRASFETPRFVRLFRMRMKRAESKTALILRSPGASRGVAKDAKRAGWLSLALVLAACGAPTAPIVDDAVLRALDAAPAATGVNAAAIINADANPGEWLSARADLFRAALFAARPGQCRKRRRISGLAWSFDLGVSRGIEATPIIHDGVMYVTGSWNIVHALDARTGAAIWSFDPQVDRSRASVMCCDIVNRGVAIWEGKVFTGTIDGRLIALDAKTGAKLWDVLTVDLAKPYSITGAPRIVKGKVLIGNGGAELGVQGVSFRLRRQFRQDALALLHRSGKSRRRL